MTSQPDREGSCGWRFSRARPNAETVSSLKPTSDLGSDDEWQLTMGSDSDVDASPDRAPQAELGFHWEADDNEAFVEEVVDAPLPPAPGAPPSPRRNTSFSSEEFHLIALGNGIMSPGSASAATTSGVLRDEYDADDLPQASVIPGYRGVSSRVTGRKAVKEAPPTSSVSLMERRGTDAAATCAWIDRPCAPASRSASPELRPQFTPNSTSSSPGRSQDSENALQLSARTPSHSSDESHRTTTKSVSFVDPIADEPARAPPFMQADDSHAHGSPVQSLGASSAPSPTKSSGSLRGHERKASPSVHMSRRETRTSYTSRFRDGSSEREDAKGAIEMHQTGSVHRVESEGVQSVDGLKNVTALAPSHGDDNRLQANSVQKVLGTPSGGGLGITIGRTRHRPNSSLSEGLPSSRDESSLSQQLRFSARPTSSPQHDFLDTPISAPMSGNSEVFFKRAPAVAFPGSRHWTKGFHMNPRPMNSDMSYLECVVELLKGCRVLKRKNFMQANEVWMWLTSDMQAVKYKILKKGNRPLVHTLGVMRVRKLKATDRDMSLEMVGEKKPYDFIFPSRERSNAWVNGLACLIPAQASVKSRNIRSENRDSYDPLNDSWSGKPLNSRSRLNEYILLGSIGRGSFGKVKLALSTADRQFYAVKVLSKVMIRKRIRTIPMERKAHDGVGSQLSLTDVNEIAVMKDLDHPNVMKMKGVFDDVEEDRLYIVLEFLARGPLMSSSKLTGSESKNPSELRGPFIDVLSGLEYLHHNNIVHRDIKPDNILGCGDGSVKISDFGAAVLYSDDEEANRDDYNVHNSTAGTPAFTAPELCVSDSSPDCPPRCFSADIWSLGATLFYMIYGRAPFIARSVFEMYDAICTQELIFPERPEISPGVVALIRSMLRKAPESRATVASILRSQWISECPEISNKVSALRSTMLQHSREKAALKTSGVKTNES